MTHTPTQLPEGWYPVDLDRQPTLYETLRRKTTNALRDIKVGLRFIFFGWEN